LVFNQWRDELEHKVREPSIHPAIESHLIKYRSLMPSLALIINEIEVGHGSSVTDQSAKKAVAWCEYLESHMYRIYGSAINPALQAAEMILARRDKLPDGFTLRDVQRKCWAGLTDREHINKAIDELIDCGYLRESKPAPGSLLGRHRVLLSYYWNPIIKEK